MHCKNCKWWKLGYCERVDTTEEFAIEVNVADDHNLETKLRTGPEFGCVLHEQKETTWP